MIFCVEDLLGILETDIHIIKYAGMEAEGFEDGEVFF